MVRPMTACPATEGRSLVMASCQAWGRPSMNTGRMMIRPTTAAIASAVRRIRVPMPSAKRPTTAR